MAETAKKATPKGMEGVEAIMNGKGAMEVAQGRVAVKEVAAEAPYELIAQEDSPTPTAESYAKEMVEEYIPSERVAPKEEKVFTDADIIEHEKKGKELEDFFQKELEKAQKAVAKLSGKSPVRKVARAAKSIKPSESGGDSGDDDKKD